MSTALDKAREAVRLRREAGEDIERLDPIEKARRNPTSRALAINAMCWDCQGGGANPGTRWLIGNCAAMQCPLHGLRPYRKLAGRPKPTALQAGGE